MPLKQSSHGLVQYVKDGDNICLISNQARYIYGKVEKDSLVKVEMIEQEIEEDKLGKDSELGKESLYQDMNINNLRKTMLIAIFHQWRY